MRDLFEKPIQSVKVRRDVYAHKYRNGTININGTKFLMHSMKSAIKTWRSKN